MIARCLATMAGLLLVLSAPLAAEKPSPARNVSRVGDSRPVGTHAGGIASVDFSPDGKLLVTGGGDKKIRVWDVATGKIVHEWKGPSSFACAVRFSPDGQTVAAAGYETSTANVIYRYDVVTGKELPTLPGHPTGGARRLAFHPDGKRLVSGGFDGHVRVWDLTTNKELRSFKVETGTVYGLALSPDGKLVVTAGRDGLKLWELDTGKEQPRDGMARHSCVAVAFSYDGKLVASGDAERVKLWEVATGKLIADLNGFKGELSQLIFSRDGRILYTASYDRCVRLWEVRTGEMMHEVEAHAGWVWGIAVSPDERTLASCSVDTRLLVWSVAEFDKPKSGGTAHLSETELKTHLKQLASNDAGKAFQAVCALAGNPDKSLPLLRSRLMQPRESGPSTDDVDRWIRELDSDVYRVREEASRKLAEAGVRALPPMQRVLAKPPSLEVKKRIQRLVARLDPTELPTEELVALRGVQTLEYIATPEARKLLEQLTSNKTNPRLGDEASRAIARLRGKPNW